jgi:uncharacterized membrane protein YfcA
MVYILLQNGRIKPFFCNFAAKILMFNLYNYQHYEKVYWVIYVLAVFVGMSKTGVQGLAILTVPLLAIDACAIPFVLVGAFLGIRIVKFLPERGFWIFTSAVTIISILVMLLA